MYRCSLAIEPRSTGGKNGVQLMNNLANQHNGTTSKGKNEQANPFQSTQSKLFPEQELKIR